METGWRRTWQPTPVFLPGDPTDRGAWRATVLGVAESDSTEATKRLLTRDRGRDGETERAYSLSYTCGLREDPGPVGSFTCEMTHKPLL